MTLSHDIVCSFCKQKLDLNISSGLFRCTNCQRKNLLIQESDLQVSRLVVATGKQEAISEVSLYLAAERTVDPDFLSCLEKASECRLYYVPCYESTGMATVRFTMKKTLKHDKMQECVVDCSTGSDARTVAARSTQYDTRIQFQEFYFSACAVHDLEWEVGDLKPVSNSPSALTDLEDIQSHAIVLTPTITFARFQSSLDVKTGTENEPVRDILVKTDRLIYRPVWRITTRFAGTVYEAYVDAVTGECSRAAAPQSISTRATAFSLSFAVMAFLCSLIIVTACALCRLFSSDLTPWTSGIDALMVFLSLPLLALVTVVAALAGYGWDRMYYRPEMLKTGRSVSVYIAEKTEDSWLHRLHESTLKSLCDQLERIFDIHD